MVQMPRVGLAFGALRSSTERTGFAGALAGAGAAARGAETSALDALVSAPGGGAAGFAVRTFVVGRVVDVGAPADCTASARGAPAVVTPVVAAGGVAVAVVVEQWAP